MANVNKSGPLKNEDIVFRDGTAARLVRSAEDTPASSILTALALKSPRLVLLLMGGADEIEPEHKPLIENLVAEGVIRGAFEAGAIVIDGGTASGIMAMAGRAASEIGKGQVPLIGVAPAAKVTWPDRTDPPAGADLTNLDPNHSYFVLTPGAEWGAELHTIFSLADALHESAPVIAVLINGGENTKLELFQCMRRKWPVLVLQGTGRLADSVADSQNQGANGELEIIRADLPHAELRRLIGGRSGPDESLRRAWDRHDLFNTLAKSDQRGFRVLQNLILVLGVAATVLAISGANPDQGNSVSPMQLTLIVTPVLISFLVAVSNRFRFGNRWILFRAAAESIKREIYRYRVRSGSYSPDQCRQAPCSLRLQAEVQAINTPLVQTDVNRGYLGAFGTNPWWVPFGSKPHAKPPQTSVATPDRYSILSGDEYVRARIDDQIGYYNAKTRRFDRYLKWLYVGAFLAGASGTVLAAVKLNRWVALTTAIATALASMLQIHQIENNLIQYNQALAALRDVRDWWAALSRWDQGLQKNIDQLVNMTEEILKGEQAGWVQQMQSTVDKLRQQQADAAKADIHKT